MKKIVCLLIASYFFNVFAFSQQKINVDLNHRPIGDLFELIEKQTNFRIYGIPTEIDSLIVSVTGTYSSATEILQKALSGTSFRVSEFQNSLFILQNKELVTSLHDSYRRTDQRDVITPFTSLADNEQDEKTSSEHKVYPIGNKNKPAAQVKLTGYIKDAKTGEPLHGISVFTEKPMIATTTNLSGFYSILLPSGRKELNIRGIGMNDTKRQVMLYSDGKMDIEMEEKTYSLQEVTILSDRIDNIKATSIGVERLKMESIKNIPTAFGESDIVRIVLTLPGVKSVGEISGGFNVRGGATDQNLILYNDGTIYNPTHLFGLFSTFNPDMVKDMELYKSSIPAKYGGRISSVLDINTREGNKKKIQGSAGIGLLTGKLTLEGPLFSEKTSFIVGGRTTYSDWLLNLIPKKNGFGDASAGFYDMSGSIKHHFNERNSGHLNAYYSHDRFRFNMEESYSYETATFSGKWRHIFNPKFIGTFVAGYDHYRYDMESTEHPTRSYTIDFKIDQIFGKADFSYYATERHTLSFGINSIYYDLHPGNYLPKGIESLVDIDRIQTENALENAVYLGDKWDIAPKFSVDLGIRYSGFNVLGPRSYNIYSSGFLPSETTILRTDSAGGILKTYHGPEFRFSMRYEINEDMSVKAGVNSMRQYIHKISNNTTMSPTDTWKLSDVNILPQTGTQFVVGLFKNFADGGIETSVETYYKIMNAYLDYRNNAQLLMNHHLETDVVGTEGKAYGMELMVKKIRGQLNGWVSYTYSRTLLHQQEEAGSAGVFDKWYPADFDKPHEIKFTGNYKFTHRYSLSLNCDYSTGRPITLPVAKYRYAGGEFVYYADRNKYRIPDFFRVDLSLNIEQGHQIIKLFHAYFTIGVYNITGRKNAYSVYYVSEDGKMKGYKLSIFGVPIPYVSYNINF